jgi:hypothetical protein
MLKKNLHLPLFFSKWEKIRELIKKTLDLLKLLDERKFTVKLLILEYSWMEFYSLRRHYAESKF